MCDKPHVRVSAIGDVFKIWLWAAISLLGGILLTPIAYNGGKALSELSGTKDFNGFLNKAAAWSGATEMEDFFKICWPLCAILLLLPLIEWLRLGTDKSRETPWEIRIPSPTGSNLENAQPLLPNQYGPLQGVTGFLLTFGSFVLIGYAMVRAGSFTWASDLQAWRRSLVIDIGWALVMALIIEVFFRCVVLGIFLRAMKVLPAIALASALFAGIHYILAGFQNTLSLDGETLTPMHLAQVLFFGGDLIPRFIIVFMPWFTFGCVLGWARWRTASLWLPTGLLMGWLLADQLFTKATKTVEIHDSIAKYLAADSVHNGLIPLLAVITLGGFVHIITEGYVFKKKASE
ncbi:CPBP family intramembrane glutamic endopeptidase [Luteolibacter algae]|uniref:CPBP family intramembrane glutamic endopeptidase n=1 Tax=Luteolibacter algae TaxID=454151 RepID=A0ABW5D2V6_9BACT